MTKEYVIKKRNNSNDVFIIQKKLSKRWRWLRCIFHHFTLQEWEIMSLMSLDRGFYIYNSDDDSYTPVVKRGGHIRSKPNKTKVDNISQLPLI